MSPCPKDEKSPLNNCVPVSTSQMIAVPSEEAERSCLPLLFHISVTIGWEWPPEKALAMPRVHHAQSRTSPLRHPVAKIVPKRLNVVHAMGEELCKHASMLSGRPLRRCGSAGRQERRMAVKNRLRNQ